ncbi:Gfo/Idh/MocA family oxidoreductase [Candidatus Peregrinibacteria bacterium]|nr:Gfo/Idh/MocA family oxidoreductase [Candidatus Peregrinibacteria bacterium]
MNNICIIGAGQLGSRHLQALQALSIPLNITVVDPSQASLQTARERFEAVQGSANHSIEYVQSLENTAHNFDLAIVATTSNYRRQAVESLLQYCTAKFMILEKILFQKREDYEAVGKLLEQKNCKTWVNCSMRTMTFYADLPSKISKCPLTYLVTGSNYGMITNIIHYIDHIAYLTGCYDYEVTTGALDPKPVASKRPGFLELNGTLTAHFKDGSHATFNCFEDGDVPFLVEIHSKEYRCIVRENERKAWESSPKNGWQWQEVEAVIPFQSQMTASLTENILQTGNCPLVPYEKAAKLHLTLLEALSEFLNNKSGQKFDLYPFT